MLRLGERRVIAIVLAALAAFAVFDLFDDAGQGASQAELWQDATDVLLPVVLLIYIYVLQPWTQRKRHRALAAKAQRQAEDLTRLKAMARKQLEGLALFIDKQFDTWLLTAAEKEVALLLLKGLSLREVADLRNISERTARQQATTVYGKAGLSGRAELSAFFLEDLLLPNTDF